ncbi:hypothetical protein AB0I84_46455 [Streptomyces spectabilis]|uniref:hypothetical protein n=1 Tax=Streptomyces spectabilis TaxID=68270 RepID=UPI0033C90111
MPGGVEWICQDVSESPLVDGDRSYGRPQRTPTPDAAPAQDRLLRLMGRTP